MQRPSILVALAVLASITAPTEGAAQAELCDGAERFVREVIGMVAISEPDTIDDWRTRSEVPGCRVTAAGATAQSPQELVRSFYEIVAYEGWSRTPDPRDAPNEASLRFRRDGVDCLFNYYDNSVSLNTEAEMDVGDAVHVGAGQELYYFLVLCTPAMPAAPRG